MKAGRVLKSAPRGEWLSPLLARRAALRREIDQRHDSTPVSPRPPPARAIDSRDAPLLQAARVPERVAAEHCVSLAPAIADIAALARNADRVPAHHARQFERALDQFYKLLGFELSLFGAGSPAPGSIARGDDDPAGLAKHSIAAFRELAESVEANEHVVPALFSAIALFDSGLRRQAQRKQAPEGHEAMRLASDATQVIRRLIDDLRDRSGLTSALNCFPHLAEHLERGDPEIMGEERRAIWICVGDLLRDVIPQRGFDQAMAAELSRLMSSEVEAGGAPGAIVRRVAHAFQAGPIARRSEIVRRMRELVEAEPEGSESRKCLAFVSAALEKTLAANPSGPESLFEVVSGFFDHAKEHLDRRENEGSAMRIWGCAAAIVSRVAETRIALDVISHLDRTLPSALGKQAAIEALQRATDAKDLRAVSRSLFRFATACKDIEEAADVAPALARLDDLDELRGVQVAMAFPGELARDPHVSPLLDALIARARGSTGDDLFGMLQSFSLRYASAVARIGNYGRIGQLAPSIALRIAELTSGHEPSPALLNAIAQALNNLSHYLNHIDYGEIIGPSPDGGPGILKLCDPSVRYRHPPVTFLTSLGYALYAGAPQDPAGQLEAARVAIRLAESFGNMDGDTDIPFQRIQEDWKEVAGNPAKLTPAARPQGTVSIRLAQSKGSLEGYLRAHSELPPELALAAGLHLSSEQIGWLVERAGAAHGRDTVRSLRDLVFACIKAARKDTIDALMASPSPQKALSGIITDIGREYRLGRAETIPWDLIIESLKKGGDPLAEIQAKRVEEGLKLLDLDALAEGKSDPDGMAEIARCATAITNCLTYYEQQKAEPNGTDRDIDHGACIAPFMAVLKSVATGTWPKQKYDNEVGRRLLSILSPEQEAIWRSEMITQPNGAPVDEGARARDALQLLRGLAIALPMAIAFDPELGPLDWTRGSLAKVRESQEALLREIRNVEKGSPRHRELGRSMAAINRNLSVLELKVALDERLVEPVQNIKMALIDLRPLLEISKAALRRFGHQGCLKAVLEALKSIQDLRTSSRQGRYAIDEDTLESLILSHTDASSSCLRHSGGFRRWALAGAAADANIRMLRVYDGPRFGYRAFLKLFPVELEGYKGPALWIDPPHREGSGEAEDLQLLYKNAIQKGLAMGIPIIGSDPTFTKLAEEMGLATKLGNVQFYVDEGNTGCQHSDRLFGGAGNIRALRKDQPYYLLEKPQLNIVMPEPK